jgi:hypothetical protein
MRARRDTEPISNPRFPPYTELRLVLPSKTPAKVFALLIAAIAKKKRSNKRKDF